MSPFRQSQFGPSLLHPELLCVTRQADAEGVREEEEEEEDEEERQESTDKLECYEHNLG